ncbi:hypothetical protein BCD64_16745 [Nostoc sp. MBR 210]|nr:hypothetical protein BCD64_16745 [Nostoc sp. MBR 210]
MSSFQSGYIYFFMTNYKSVKIIFKKNERLNIKFHPDFIHILQDKNSWRCDEMYKQSCLIIQ